MLAGLAGEGLAPLPFAEARFTRAIGVVTRTGHVLPPLAQRFLEILRQGVKERESETAGLPERLRPNTSTCGHKRP
jgi:DNA-binding transcriptional LysR family regulator